MPILPSSAYVEYSTYNDYGWYYNLTQQGTYFVYHIKSNAVYEIIEYKETGAEHILEEQVIRLTSVKAKKNCLIKLRRIPIIREEDSKVLSLIINNLDRTAQ